MAAYGSDQGVTPALLWIVIWAGAGLAAISAFARSLVRINRARRFSADDYLILFALASLVSTGVLYSLNIDFLFELHSILDADGLPSSSFDQDLQFFLRCQFTVVMLFWTTLWAVKFAILMYYKPLFDGLSGRWLWFWWGVFAFTLLSYMGCWVTLMLSCRPIANYFTASCSTPQENWAQTFSLYFATSADVVCDVLVMALLLRLLYGLNISKRQRCGLAGIFAIGFIIIVFAIIRVAVTSAPLVKVDTILLALWSTVEASVAVTVACLPPFFVYFTSRSESRYQDVARYAPSSTSKPLCKPLQRKGSVPFSHLSSEGNSRQCAAEAEMNHIGCKVDANSSKPISRNWDKCGRAGRSVKPKMGSSGSNRSRSEDALPIMASEKVHIRNDIYVTSEPFDHIHESRPKDYR